MEGFLGVDRDGAPIMAPTIKPRNLGPKKQEALRAEEIITEAPILAPMEERVALTVHEIVEAVTEPPSPTVGARKTAKHPAGLGVLMQKEFESSPVDVQHSVATFRLPNPGKVISRWIMMVSRHTGIVFKIVQPPKCHELAHKFS